MHIIEILMYLYVALFGLVVGSFCNVCILRIPAGESVVTTPSHCPRCDRRLRPWELFPLFSFLLLHGKCHGCKAPISPQYPLIEAANALFWVIAFARFGLSADGVLAALLCSALLVLWVMDARTQFIPPLTSIFFGCLGVLMLLFNLSDWQSHLLGFVTVAGLLLLLLIVSGGKAIGGGDVKLMAGCGLFLGFAHILLAFILACVLGAVIHVIRMKFFGAGRTLAMGPYLAGGVAISLFAGDAILQMYLGLFAI